MSQASDNTAEKSDGVTLNVTPGLTAIDGAELLQTARARGVDVDSYKVPPPEPPELRVVPADRIADLRAYAEALEKGNDADLVTPATCEKHGNYLVGRAWYTDCPRCSEQPEPLAKLLTDPLCWPGHEFVWNEARSHMGRWEFCEIGERWLIRKSALKALADLLPALAPEADIVKAAASELRWLRIRAPRDRTGVIVLKQHEATTETTTVTTVQQFTELLGYPPPPEYGLPDVCPECERPKGHSDPHGMAQDDDYPPRRIAREAHLDAMAAAHAVSREEAGKALHTAWQESFTPKERAWGIPWDCLVNTGKVPWLLAAEYAHHHTATLRQLLRLAVLRMHEAADAWENGAAPVASDSRDSRDKTDAIHDAMNGLTRAVRFQLPRATDLVQPVKRDPKAATDIRLVKEAPT